MNVTAEFQLSLIEDVRKLLSDGKHFPEIFRFALQQHVANNQLSRKPTSPEAKALETVFLALALAPLNFEKLLHVFDTIHPFTGSSATFDRVTLAEDMDLSYFFPLANPRTDKGQAVVLYLHGGFFHTNTTVSMRGCIVELVKRLGKDIALNLFMLQYDIKNPVRAVQQCCMAYRWLLNSKHITARQIILMGESSGGGLCMLSLLSFMRVVLPPPVMVILISPWLDFSLSQITLNRDKAKEAFLTAPVFDILREVVQQLKDADIDVPYVKDTAETHTHLESIVGNSLLLPIEQLNVGKNPSVKISPHHMVRTQPDTLSPCAGKTKIYIAYSEHEPFIDDVLELIECCQDIGITTISKCHPYMQHCFPLLFGYVPEADETVEHMTKAVKKALEEANP